MDIAVGDAQSLGLPLSFGGHMPAIWPLAQSLLRRMPGRICGETVDRHGRRTFVLTIQARETASGVKRPPQTSAQSGAVRFGGHHAGRAARRKRSGGSRRPIGSQSRILRQALCETGWFCLFMTVLSSENLPSD